jgi:hypothetical protein
MSSKRETKDAISNTLKGLRLRSDDTGSQYLDEQVFTPIHLELESEFR